MIVLDVEQGSDVWHAARCGIPTASNFGQIWTPTGKASTQAKGYMHRLLAEWLTGTPTVVKQTEWMERGTELEAEARDWYEFQTGAEVERIGLAYLDESRMVACSPDGLVEAGGLEIKCPAPHTHVEYLLAGKLPTTYIPQVQGSMYVTGRQWWDFLSYHPDMPPVLVRVARDDEYIAGLAAALHSFCERMAANRLQLAEKRNQ